MLESVREICVHVNKQLTNHSSATEREIAEELRWLLSSNLVSRLVKVGQLAMSDRQQSCSTLLCVWHTTVAAVELAHVSVD